MYKFYFFSGGDCCVGSTSIIKMEIYIRNACKRLWTMCVGLICMSVYKQALRMMLNVTNNELCEHCNKVCW